MNRDDNLLIAPLIVIGPGRSGSTVISEVLFAHEDLAWPSNYLETFPGLPALDGLRRVFDNRMWRVLGERGQLNRTQFLNTLIPWPAEAYPFWERLTRPEIDFARSFLLDERATAAERARIRRAVAQLVARQGRRRFAMKITGPGRIGYLKSVFPDARFVNVIRDPVATVNSLLKVPFWWDLGRHRLTWTGAYSDAELAAYAALKDDPVAGTAFQVRKVMETTVREAEETGAEMITVRYEDFIADPAALSARILAFAGLPPSVWVMRKLAATLVHDRNARAGHDERQTATVAAVFDRSF